MNIINKVLVPVNFSKSSSAAAHYVCGMAKSDESLECSFLHVLSDDEHLETVQKDLDNYLGKFQNEGIKCDSFILKGNMNKAIIEFKKSNNVDLIIMGTSGSSTDVNTKTSDLLENSSCPVLIIPECTADFKMNSIVLAIDEKQFDDASDLQLFHDLAKWFDAKVHLLKINRGADNGVSVPEEKEDTLEYYLQCLDYQYSFSDNENLEVGIKNYIEENKIDTLAIIPRSQKNDSKHSHGALTKVLALHTKVPLLVLA